MERPQRKAFVNRRASTKRPVAVKLSQIQSKTAVPRKRVVIYGAVVAILLLLMGGYIWYATSRTAAINTTLAQGMSSVKTEVAGLKAGLAKKSTTERAAALLSVKKASNPLDCSGFQMLYLPLGDAQKRCTQYSKKANDLANAANDLAVLLNYDVSLQKQLNTALSVNNDPTASWKEKQTAWADCVVAIKKISPPVTLVSAQDDLRSRIERLATAWAALNTANISKKLADYTKAKKNLLATYDVVQKSMAQYKQEYAATQSAFVAAYSAFEKQ